MTIAESMKKWAGHVTGWKQPRFSDLAIRQRKLQPYRFADDGETPNNPYFAFIHYRTPVAMDPAYDPAAIFEVLFATHGWKDSWRDGIYDFLHFHTHTHEVLGIARGHVEVQFGGVKGKRIYLNAGDVVVLPAGTGHHSIRKSRDLLVVGAYPQNSKHQVGKYDEPKPGAIPHEEAVASIAKVGRPAADPVYGKDGPLRHLWRAQH